MGKRNKKKFQLYKQIEVTDYGAEGKAIAKVDQLIIFIPFVVPGDVIDVQITKKRKNFLEAKAINFHKFSNLRIKPQCKHFGLCGGCRWQMLDYQYQLEFKQKQIKDILERIAKVWLPEINPIIPSKKIYYYRNKLEFTFSNRKWLTHYDSEDTSQINDMNGVGFHIPGMFDRIIDIKYCYLQNEPSNAIRLELKKFAIEHNLSFYNIKKREGLLRNLIIRNTNTKHLMIIIVFNDPCKEKIYSVLKHLKNRFPEITSLMYVVNQKQNDDISDLDVKLFSGKDFITAEIPSAKDPKIKLKFKIQAKSFYQTNSDQAYLLYQKAFEFADFKGHELVYDLYSGTGTIANFIASSVKKVIGLEFIQSAVEDAKENSKFNCIENTEFFAGEIGILMDDLFISKHGKPDVIITDPPRIGMQKDVIQQILKILPEKIVYISCNPSTQARDIALMDKSYIVQKIQPIDMFPHTHHIENIVLLHRR